MGRRDEANVYFVSAVAPEPLEFLLLQDSKKFCLEFQRDVADFIKEECSLVGEFKAPRLLCNGASECPFS